MKKIILMALILISCQKTDFTCYTCTDIYIQNNKQIAESNEDICNMPITEGESIDNISGVGIVKRIRTCKGIK